MSEQFEWRMQGHKYDYSMPESLAMVLITGITNLAAFPAIILLYKRGFLYQAYLGFFTFFTSFMYHFMESIGAERIFMTELEWHQLDNIGSILSFITVFIYMANFKDQQLEQHLNYSALLVVICLQTASPWNLMFTIGPIAGYIILLAILGKIKKTVPFENTEMTTKGGLCILVGVIFFFLSQDEYKDYLRIYHGLWHLVIDFSAMYTWQTNEKEGEHVYTLDLFKKPIKKEKPVYDQVKLI